jgi:hypothetical protein
MYPCVLSSRSSDAPQDTFDHTQPGAQDRDERQLLPAHPPASAALQWRLDRRCLEGQLARGLIRHQHGDLVDQLLEDFRWRSTVTENGQLVLDERMPNDKKGGKLRGGVHGAEGTIFARMKEYQAVVLRLTQRTKDDEDAITDLMNERSRGGWNPAMMSQDAQRLVIIFQRAADGDG